MPRRRGGRRGGPPSAGVPAWPRLAGGRSRVKPAMPGDRGDDRSAHVRVARAPGPARCAPRRSCPAACEPRRAQSHEAERRERRAHGRRRRRRSGRRSASLTAPADGSGCRSIPRPKRQPSSSREKTRTARVARQRLAREPPSGLERDAAHRAPAVEAATVGHTCRGASPTNLRRDGIRAPPAPEEVAGTHPTSLKRASSASQRGYELAGVLLVPAEAGARHPAARAATDPGQLREPLIRGDRIR